MCTSVLWRRLERRISGEQRSRDTTREKYLSTRNRETPPAKLVIQIHKYGKGVTSGDRKQKSCVVCVCSLNGLENVPGQAPDAAYMDTWLLLCTTLRACGRHVLLMPVDPARCYPGTNIDYCDVSKRLYEVVGNEEVFVIDLSAQPTFLGMEHFGTDP